MTEFKYLREAYPQIHILDHRLTPEVRAMLCAMASRMPAGGIVARYTEVVEAVAGGLKEQGLEEGWLYYLDPDLNETKEDGDGHKLCFRTGDGFGDIQSGPMKPEKLLGMAEDRLCEYPIPERVQGFFDQFVANYGHASIMELTGSPSIYIEGVSWYAAYLSFDSPLCSGQEFSTRAVRHKDWPMARECLTHDVENPNADQSRKEGIIPLQISTFNLHPIPEFRSLHDQWFDVFEAEVEAWKNHLSDPKVREELGIADKEPFRPALDRARWAIPGTIATGFAHTGHLRERSRTIKDALAVVGKSEGQTLLLWRDIRRAYDEALPGMGGMGLREALYQEGTFRIPGHLQPKIIPQGPEVRVGLHVTATPFDPDRVKPFKRPAGEKVYVDPYFNAAAQVTVAFQCSLAVSRDWHRHRTAYPWRLNIVEDEMGIMLHPAYNEALSQEGNASTDALLEQSTEIFHRYYDKGDIYRAMLALPLGTLVEMETTMGLRDAIYMLELRSQVHGANFEYKAQATEALRKLTRQLMEYPHLFQYLGLEAVSLA